MGNIIADALLNGAEKNGVINYDCRAFYTPRVAKAWVHFDLSIYDKNEIEEGDWIGVGKLLQEERSSSSIYGGMNNLIGGSFRIDEVKEYFLAQDKKEFRKYSTIQEIPGEPEIIEKVCWITKKLVRYHISERYIDPALICAHCLFVSAGPRLWSRNPERDPFAGPLYKGYWQSVSHDRWFQIHLCCNCKVKIKSLSPRIPVFYSIKNDLRDPRAFLYQSKVKPKKSFFKKYVKRHLNRVRKLRPISQQEVSFFRSWLGAKDIAALAN